jgi:integrator complex subunit 3
VAHQFNFIPYVILMLLRRIPSHATLQLEDLLRSEVELACFLLNERLEECKRCGRELVRELAAASRVSEELKSCVDQLIDIKELMRIPTKRNYLQEIVSPKIEAQLLFLLKNVKFGNHNRYQNWLAARCFTQERESIIPDIIRFIVVCHHPTNAMLRSDVLPRWALLGWMLSCTKASTQQPSFQFTDVRLQQAAVVEESHLSLFFDWLFYEAHVDNIMLIEPGILIIAHSVAQFPQASVALLKYLSTAPQLFGSVVQESVLAGLQASIRDILTKRVISSISPIMGVAGPELQTQLQSLFNLQQKRKSEEPLLQAKRQQTE